MIRLRHIEIADMVLDELFVGGWTYHSNMLVLQRYEAHLDIAFMED